MMFTRRAEEALRGKEVMTEHDLLDILSDMTKGGLGQPSRELDFTVSYLHDVLRGRRFVSEKMAGKLGFNRVVVFTRERKEGGK